MLDPQVRELLDGTLIAHLATILPDGSPYSVPLWIGTRSDHVAIMTGPGSLKARNLRRDPRVAISRTPPDAPFPPIVMRGRVLTWPHQPIPPPTQVGTHRKQIAMRSTL